jgi:hypothetical protein
MAAMPSDCRLEPRTAVLQQSRWRGTGEDAFWRKAVRLAKVCNGVAWTTDIVTRTMQPITGKAVVPDWGMARESDHQLPLVVESRLSRSRIHRGRAGGRAQRHRSVYRGEYQQCWHRADTDVATCSKWRHSQ